MGACRTILSVLSAVAVLGSSQDAASQDLTRHPFVEAVTVGRRSSSASLDQPGERFDHLRILPEVEEQIRAHRPLAPYLRRVLPQVARLRSEVLSQRDNLALDQVRGEGWAQFNLVYGLGGSSSTLAENVGQLGGLQTTNEIMSSLGLLMTAWQVTIDLSDNDDFSAAMNGYQGVILFQLSRWGTSAIQVAGVGAGLMNIALQAFGQEAGATNLGAWEARYTRFYEELEQAAEQRARNALMNPGSYQAPTFEEDLARVQGAMASGYSRHDWGTLLTHYLRRARSPGGFEATMLLAIDDYVDLYWNSRDYEEIDSPLSTSDFQSVRDALNAAHRRRLILRLMREVLPEVAARAFIMDLRQQLLASTQRLRDELNAPLELVVTALELDGPVQLAIPRPAGGVWRPARLLQPGQTLRLRMTRMAWLRAGGPDLIRLERPDGALEARFSFRESQRAQVVFGAAESPAAFSFRVSEGAQNCAASVRQPGGQVENAVFSRPARGEWSLHASQMQTQADGSMVAIYGRYAPQPGQWEAASMSSITLNDASSRVTFTEPLFDDLAEMTCRADVVTPTTAEQMAAMVASMGTNFDMSCRFAREERAIVDGVESRTRCESQGAMRIEALMVPFPDGARFVAPSDLMPSQGELVDPFSQLLQPGLGMPPMSP